MASTAIVIAGDAGVHALRAVSGVVHPVQREDEQRRRDDVGELDDGVRS